MISRYILVLCAGLAVQALARAGEAAAQGTIIIAQSNYGGNLGANTGANYGGVRRGRGGGGFSFTGPAEFYTDGRMTCYRAKAVMRFRLGYSDLVVHNCNGRRYQIEGRRAGKRWLVTLDAFTTNPVKTQRLR